MLKLHKYHGINGNHTVVITKQGTKWIHYVMVDYPVRVCKVRKDELKFFRELAQTSTVQRYLEVGARLGITEGAKAALNQAEIK